MIEIKNVTKSYNGTTNAVENLNLTVEDGEIVGFIGHNGAGKTTIMKMLTGILKPTSGEIFINGLNIETQGIRAKQEIGYIGDSPDMFLRLKGIEFINFIADIYQVPPKERKEIITKLSKDFGMEQVLDQQMIGYSHGMRQKMMVLAALVHNPPVWILDEPLIGLDPTSAYQLKSMMLKHKEAGNSVLFSTHVLEVAQKLCDKVVIIKKGKVIFYGTLEMLTEQYKKTDLEAIFLEMMGSDQEEEENGGIAL